MASSPSRGGRPLGPPMLCKTIDVVPDDEQYLASRKFDGWRALAAIGDGKVKLTSREGHAVGSVPYIEDALLAVTRPGTVLDGELVDLAGPRQLKRTGSILPFGKPHKPTVDSPPLTYAIFDVLFDGDTDLRDTPLHERLQLLGRLFESKAGHKQTGPLLAGRPEPALLYVEHRPSSSEYAEQLIDAGEEGVVVKHRDSLYRHGARNAGWWKYKPQETVDAECIGIAPGEGGVGTVGSIAFRLPSGVEGSAGSGISSREWLDMTGHPELYVGRIVELAHHGEEKSGALRHPVYRGVRDPRDKAAPRRRQSSRQVPGSAALATAVAGGSRKRRNYQAMGDSKLLTCIRQLRAGEGDAYDRCIERGSGDPQGDHIAALDVANSRGLSL
jgi:bifunctional non-homologous end joining protein LigD